jgi:hypothetical protein
MSLAGFFARVDDRLNPIVVKELRQAVAGRFVTVVLLLFLFVQVAVLCAYLLLSEVWSGGLDLEAQHGRTVFTILQGILLSTCLLFLPLYTGVRLAAERSDTNVDLLFISTLRPRSIISGKFLAALVLAVLIFSACAPFMTFTYLLRGLDLFSILLVLGIDFFVVVVSIQLSIFFGAIPGHWLLKVFLGLLGLLALLMTCFLTLSATVNLLLSASTTSLVDSPDFWAFVCCGAAGGLALIGLLFTWSLAMICPPSANRALPSRLMALAAWLGTGAVFFAWDRIYERVSPGSWGAFLLVWICLMAGLCCLQIVIAVNEREAWGPRVARMIPRPWLLRPAALLLYSGSAGGIVFAALLFGLTWLAVQGFLMLTPVGAPAAGVPGFPGGMRLLSPRDYIPVCFEVVGIVALYVYAYAMTALLVRKYSGLKIRIADTWVIMIFLLAVGCAVPLMLSYAFAGRSWRYDEQIYWFLNNPIAGAFAAGNRFDRHRGVFFAVAGGWAAFVTLLSVPWFVQQVLRFRPYRGSPVPVAVPAPVLATAADLDATQTAQ